MHCQRLCTGRPDKNDCVESLGHEVTFEDSRWSVDGNSAGSTNTGMNIAVYSLPDHMLMDCRTFDMTQIAWDE